MVFFIAIYGLGEFSYYQGRSHRLVLPTAFYPAVFLSLLVAINFWDPIRSFRWRDLLRASQMRLDLLSAAACMLWCALGLLSFGAALPAAAVCLSKPQSHHATEVIAERLRDIRGKKGVILVDPGNALHTIAGSYSTLPVSSPSEVILIRQIGEVQKAINSDDTEFVLIGGGYYWLRYIDFPKLDLVWRTNDMALFKKTSSQSPAKQQR